MRNNFRRFLSVAFAIVMVMAMMFAVSATEETNVAKIGDTEYAKLADAITAAVAGDTITLVDDVTENVTISKSITLDGADNQYTGKMTISDNKNVTIQDVNFVKGCVNELAGSHGYLTIKDCTFDGVDKSIGYAITHRGGDKLIIEGSTANNYSTGMLYVPSAVALIEIKDVEASNVVAAFNITYSGNGTFENVKFNNVTYGIHFQIYGSRTYTVKNSDLSGATNPFWFWDKSSNTEKVTVVFEGENIVHKFQDPIPAGSLKLAEGATLVAPEGLSVTTDVADHNVVYSNGVYSVVDAYVAMIGETGYMTLKEAVAAAQDGDTITMVDDYEVASSDAVIADYDMYAFVSVTDKAITIDLNGKKITAVPELDKALLGFFYVGGSGKLTLLDSSEAKDGSVEVITEKTEAYSFATIDSENTDAKLCIESGNYYIDRVDAGQSMIYANNGELAFVSGGNFVLANAKTMDNNGIPYPWIFNAYGNTGANYVTVTGGTYNVDPTHHQGEVKYPRGYSAVENADGTWTVTLPVKIGETGYASLAEAVAAAKDGDTITLLSDITLNNSEAEIAAYDMYAYLTVTDKKITIDLNGKTITANPSFDKPFYGVIVVLGTGDVTLMDSSEAQTGAINVTVAEGTESYSMMSTDGATASLSIESGNYYIDRVDLGYSMIYIAQTCNSSVSGGNFVLGNAYSFEKKGAMVPWIFNTYKNGANFVQVTGGTYNANPQNRHGEVKFPKGYVAYEDIDGTWKVARGPIIVKQPADTTIGYNKMAKFAPVIVGDGLTYKWYYRDTNSNTFRKSTITTATYDIKGTLARDGREVYCVAKDSTGKTVTTDVVTLTVVPNEELEIVSQPTVVEGALDTTVSIKMDVKGDGLTYKWYFRDKGAKNFQKSSLKTATYDIKLTEARMDREVYCVITDAFGNMETSAVVTLKAVCTVDLKIIAQPTYEAVAVGETATVKMDVEGEYLTYAWYFINAGDTTPFKSSITDSEYSVALTEDRVGRQVYCVITDAFGESVQTETVTLVAAE